MRIDIFAALCLVIGGAYSIWRTERYSTPLDLTRAITDDLEEIINILPFESAVHYFKDPARQQLLKKNESLIACVLREAKDGCQYVRFCIFDPELSEISCCKSYKARALDEQFIRYFGDKDMLLLK